MANCFVIQLQNITYLAVNSISAFSANSKFMKNEFIKSKRMDPSIKHQTMKPFNITTNGIRKLLKNHNP
jgi:hypothetical protein